MRSRTRRCAKRCPERPRSVTARLRTFGTAVQDSVNHFEDCFWMLLNPLSPSLMRGGLPFAQGGKSKTTGYDRANAQTETFHPIRSSCPARWKPLHPSQQPGFHLHAHRQAQNLRPPLGPLSPTAPASWPGRLPTTSTRTVLALWPARLPTALTRSATASWSENRTGAVLSGQPRCSIIYRTCRIPTEGA